MRTSFAIVLALVCAGSTTRFVHSLDRPNNSTTDNPARQATGYAAPSPQPGEPVTGSKLTRLPEDVCIVVDASLLSPITAMDGAHLRCVWLGVGCTHAGVSIGESRYHAMVAAESSASVDLSILGADIAPEVPDTSSLRSYQVTATPRSPKTWGSITSFDDDLVLEVRPITH